MGKGRYLRLQEQKKARENFQLGTIRLVMFFFTGLMGIFYLTTWFIRLFKGVYNLKNFLYAFGLLTLSVLILRHHLKKRRVPIPDGTIDLIIEDLIDPPADEAVTEEDWD